MTNQPAPPGASAQGRAACESSTDSAPRRAFLVGAAALTGVAAIALPLLAGKATASGICSSGATLDLSAGQNVVGCNVIANASVVVDKAGTNTGGLVPGVIFGPLGVNGCAQVGISASAHTNLTAGCNLTAGSASGLCFFTAGERRISVDGAGSVAIGCLSSELTNLTAGCNNLATLSVNANTPSSIALAAGAKSSPGVVGSSSLSSGVVGTSGAILPCIKSPTSNCIAGVTGRSIGTCGSVTAGKGIGVRGLSGGGIGVAGSSCLSSGVVGVSAFIPCLKSPTSACVAGVVGRSIGTCGNVTAGKGIGVKGLSAGGAGVSGASCISSGVVATTRGGSCAAALCASSICTSTELAGGATSLGSAVGVRARSGKGPALQGSSTCNVGICAQSSTTTVGLFTNNAKAGDRSATIKFQPGVCSSSTLNADCTNVSSWSAGVAGPGNVCSIPTGSFYIGKPGKGASVVVSPIGLQVKGSISACGGLSNKGGLTAKTVTLAASASLQSYQVGTSCFAILADASGLQGAQNRDQHGLPTFTVTLPPASASQGMIVFIDKIDPSRNSVTVAPSKGDTVCGYPKLTLGAAYSSVELISDGKNTWFRLACTSLCTPAAPGQY